MLKACILRVASGQMEPAQASAIAGLAKASVQLSQDLELEQRIAALEAAIGHQDTPKIRRIS
jgi:hypothetical protein